MSSSRSARAKHWAASGLSWFPRNTSPSRPQASADRGDWTTRSRAARMASATAGSISVGSGAGGAGNGAGHPSQQARTVPPTSSVPPASSAANKRRRADRGGRGGGPVVSGSWRMRHRGRAATAKGEFDHRLCAGPRPGRPRGPGTVPGRRPASGLRWRPPGRLGQARSGRAGRCCIGSWSRGSANAASAAHRPDRDLRPVSVAAQSRVDGPHEQPVTAMGSDVAVQPGRPRHRRHQQIQGAVAIDVPVSQTARDGRGARRRGRSPPNVLEAAAALAGPKLVALGIATPKRA